MSKYRRSFQEIYEHWGDQIEFIEESINAFDKGNEKEARRIATAIRVMLHETPNSLSIYKQLEKNMIFKSKTDIYSPANLVSSWLLLQLSCGPDGLKYLPNLDDASHTRIFFMIFEDWWNQIIFDDKNNCFTRKDIILFVANKDGGAHLDPEISESFAKISMYNSIGWKDKNDNSPLNNPLYSAVRVIAEELIDSINLDNSSSKRITYLLKEHEMEMRFLKKGESKRYPWSTTDITCSDETKKIVNQHYKENRKLYIREYGNVDKTRVEYIGK
ncbi:hypothetical protein KGM86_00570 [Leuconostoc lactis]|uniref:hypothetical protein n=1 Tax=Leuconostoc lactis TaxID=1246 RepID=UPI001C1FBE2C|nr:hypothetical protein [Leuconostoc lactis]MBU7536930.1 hypothetical protein [Leuconostoc lactis]